MVYRLLLICYILLPFQAFSQTEGVDELIIQSRYFMEKKLYAKAGEKLNQAISLDDNNAELYFLRAELRTRVGRHKDALDDYEKTLSINPDKLEALMGKILALHYLGEEKPALSLADESVKKHPQFWGVYYARGIINNGREKYSRAINDFDAALNLTKENQFNIYLNRGFAKLSLDEYEPAKEDITNAINLDQNNASAYHSRGLVNYALGEYESAVGDFTKSLSLNPESEGTILNLGMAYYRMDKIQEACKYFHEACQLGNNNACKMIVQSCAGAE